MAFCSAGDLSIYIRKRGELPVLTASNQGLLPNLNHDSSSVSGRILYPHPKEGGLNETIVRHFLGQLGQSLWRCGNAGDEGLMSLCGQGMR